MKWPLLGHHHLYSRDESKTRVAAILMLSHSLIYVPFSFSFAAAPECDAGQFSCVIYKFNHTNCIPSHYRCDKEQDCHDSSDEQTCSEYNLGSTSWLCWHESAKPPVARHDNIRDKTKLMVLSFTVKEFYTNNLPRIFVDGVASHHIVMDESVQLLWVYSSSHACKSLPIFSRNQISPAAVLLFDHHFLKYMAGSVMG